MCFKCLRGMFGKIKPMTRFREPEPLNEPEVQAEARNAAQRFSSSSRLVALRASHDRRATVLTLEKLRLAQEAIAVANDAIKLIELRPDHGPE